MVKYIPPIITQERSLCRADGLTHAAIVNSVHPSVLKGHRSTEPLKAPDNLPLPAD